MSCVVSSKSGWMIADTRQTGGQEICLVDAKKIVRVGEHSLLSSVGDFNTLQILQSVINDTAQSDTITLVNALSIFLMEYSKEIDTEVVVVGKNRDLYVLADCGGYWQPSTEYYCNGAGRGVAFGYLKGLEKATGKPITMQDAGDAIELSSMVDSSVNDRLYGLNLSGPDLTP